MKQAGHNRLFALQIVISAPFSAAFAAYFTWLLFRLGPVETAADKHQLLIDFIPQTFMTTLFAYGFPGMAGRGALRKGAVAPLPSRLGALNRIPFFAQIPLAGLVATLTIGAFAALVTHLFIGLPMAGTHVMAGKIAYGVALSTIDTVVALLIALSLGRRT